MASTPFFNVVLVFILVSASTSMALDNTFPKIPALYHHVGELHQVPSSILYCVALQESQKYIPKMSRSLPWPWTLNIQGSGAYLRSRKEAQ